MEARKYKTWTEEEENFIKNNYADMTCGEMSKVLKINEKKLRGKIERMGLNKKKAKRGYFIDWSDKDPYIIENYNKMTIKEIAKNLDVNYGTLYHRIKILREKGIIDYKEVVKVQKPIEFTSKIDILDGNLEIGRKYKIRHYSERGNKNGTRKFEGTLIDKTEKFYAFKGDWIECFLKVDFVIGEYWIKEVTP